MVKEGLGRHTGPTPLPVWTSKEHPNRNELLEWLRELEAPPRRVFVVHGETKSARSFGDYVREQTGWQVAVPAYRDQIALD